jgi:uncharacterized membrane protein YvlD (DUF360 family)
MLPEKHLENLERDVRRTRTGAVVLVAIFFGLSMLLLGPILHELSHILVLESLGCDYSLEAGFSFFSGVHASIQPLCYIHDVPLIIFYLAGYATTLAAAGFLSYHGLAYDRKRYLVGSIGAGMFGSIPLSIGAENDISQVLHLIGYGNIGEF